MNVDEPLIDASRLLNDGILSVHIQETDPDSTKPIDAAFRVLEFRVSSIPEPSNMIFLAVLLATAFTKCR